ncbi:type 2 lanthipeptide synthetase LanM [Halobaculum sp. MBLA0143]|uniref:type 2 lanthipeptide synthetase LanM n=1 Tax=Halobaculum sp. MBLA0143 TaxID=3079933 RepID=UPI0035234B5E
MTEASEAVEPPDSDGATAGERFAALYRESEFGDLTRRSRVAGLDPETVDARATAESAADPPDERLTEPPEWFTHLCWLAETLVSVDPRETIPDGWGEIPFANFLVPVVELAQAELASWLPTDRVADGALEPAARWLCHRLSETVAQPLHVEFRLFRDGEQSADDSTTAYEAFVASLHDGGFTDFCARYPFAARRLAVTADRWRTATATLIERLRGDWSALRDRFDATFDTLEAAIPGRGDVHDGGQTVTELRFDNGHLYYKPRPVGPDRLYAEIVDLLEGDCPVELTAPIVLPRDGYGWVAAVRTAALDGRDPATYYERVGAVLCVYYVFNGSDLHFENLLAAGDVPIPVDTETLLTRSRVPRLLPNGRADQRVVKSAVEESVFRTTLLPFETDIESRVPETAGDDISGLTAVGEMESRQLTPDWRHVNTDRMSFELTPGRYRSTGSYPHENGEPVRPEGYADAVADGFRAAYDTLSRLDPDRVTQVLSSPLDAVESRYLFRNTSGYLAALRQLRTPQCGRSGVEAGLKLERLVPELQIFDEETQQSIEPILDAERTALRDGDVPRFGIDGRDLTFRGETLLAGFFERSHECIVRDRLESLSPADRRQQSGYITASLAARRGPSDGGEE